MKRFFRKKSTHRLYSWPVLLLLAVFFIYTLYWTWGAYQKQAASIQGLEGTKRVWDQFTQREAELKENVQKLQTSRGLEEEIRERFSVAKEGEKMAIIIEEKMNGDENNPPKKWFWASFWEIFQR